MKILLAGAFGKLGRDILKALLREGHTVVAADLVIDEVPELEGDLEVKRIDVTLPETLKGICDGVDIVISTVGLTKTSATVTNYQIDYDGNVNLLNEAKRAGVKKFAYLSVIKADSDRTVPMIHAKALFEEDLKKSGLSYLIFRPTGYFYDIAKIFMPMVKKGSVTLLGDKHVYANVIDTTDLADFILEHLDDDNETYDVGGHETYSYEEIAKLFFEAAGKTPDIKRAPVFVFSALAFVNKLRKNGKEPIIRFSKWTLTNDLVGEHKYGKLSFKDYVNDYVEEHYHGGVSS